MKKLIALLLSVSVVLLSACSASLPDSLQTSPDTNLITFSDVLQSKTELTGSARWGGVIASVKNLPESTLLEVVQFELRSYGRPIVKDESAGRFRIYVKGFLDPLVYKEGRSVTVLGNLGGVESGAVGEHDYRFPVINTESVHLWKNIKTVRVEYIDPWPFARFYPYGAWNGFYGPTYRRVITINEPQGDNE